MTEQARLEGRAIARSKKAEAYRSRLRAQRAGFHELRIRGKGVALETRRRLRPVVAPLRALISWVAPYITRGLLLLVKLPAALIALLLEVTQTSLRWLSSTLGAAGTAVGRGLSRTVTPVRTSAVVGAAAAIALAVSQFFDYHGVAVGAPQYAGEVGSVAPAPLTDTQWAGHAHLYVLLPVAIAALALIVAAIRGRPELARWVAICGLVGVAVSLAIDLPQGLDAGRAGLAFSGADAQLLQGFWAQLSASAALVLCGGLLMLQLRSPATARAVGPGGQTPRERMRPEVGGVTPHWQAGS
jgi:hypothetical protein